MQGAAPATVSPGLQAADAALRQGDYHTAITEASKLLAADPKDARILFLRAKAYEGAHDYGKALADYNAGLRLNPDVPFGYQNRAAVYFRLGQFQESVADFDRFRAALPDQAPQLWQRGISLYYAGQFLEGRKQFELHQTVNPADVENAVWHFLCVRKASGLEQARAALIPIEGDRRVPMMQIYALFAGRGTPQEVLATARAGSPTAAELDNRLFYAHLYLGLYYDANGDLTQAREHIFLAADTKADHYMADVARVHARLLRAQKN